MRPANAFLRSLSPESFDRLNRNLAPVELALRSYIHTDEDVVEWVYFPETCLLSMISTGSEGQSVETSMVGNEGAAGLLEVCSSQRSHVDCLVQVDGRAWRAPAAACRSMAVADPDFVQCVLRFAELQLAEARRSAYCQAVHTAPQRLARWLTESLDRTGGRNPLPITQEFLAAMLGVQRTSVSNYASQLQREEIIRYKRGAVEITDPERLQDTACECRSYTVRQRSALGFQALRLVADNDEDVPAAGRSGG